MLTDNDKGDFPLCGLVLDISNLSRFQGVANFKLPATLVAKTASGFVALLATASFVTPRFDTPGKLSFPKKGEGNNRKYWKHKAHDWRSNWNYLLMEMSYAPKHSGTSKHCVWEGLLEWRHHVEEAALEKVKLNHQLRLPFQAADRKGELDWGLVEGSPCSQFRDQRGFYIYRPIGWRRWRTTMLVRENASETLLLKQSCWPCARDVYHGSPLDDSTNARNAKQSEGASRQAWTWVSALENVSEVPQLVDC